MRILLVTSPGGHLAQLEGLRTWFARHEHTWVAPEQVARQLPGEAVSACAWPTTRNPAAALANLVLAVRMLGRGRYDVVVSTGAAVAVPFFLVARCLGVTTAYIECLDRVRVPSLSARLCRPLSSLFCVQQPRQRRMFPGRGKRHVHVIGSLL